MGSSVAFGSGCGQALPGVPRKASLCSYAVPLLQRTCPLPHASAFPVSPVAYCAYPACPDLSPVSEAPRGGCPPGNLSPSERARVLFGWALESVRGGPQILRRGGFTIAAAIQEEPGLSTRWLRAQNARGGFSFRHGTVGTREAVTLTSAWLILPSAARGATGCPRSRKLPGRTFVRALGHPASAT